MTGYFSTLIAPGLISNAFVAGHKVWFELPFVAGYTFWVFQVFFATLVGLYYFSERLAKADPKIERDSITEPEKTD
jgi:hypothetical protein